MRLLETAKCKSAGHTRINKALFLINYYIISKIENFILKITPWNKCSLGECNDTDKKIIVSLTSFPGRIDVVAYSIKSMMLQSIKPHAIELWLAENQFPDHKLPKNIEYLVSRGLKVHYCYDLKSHKKYFYALRKQKQDEIVITVDDDIIYHPDTISRLISRHKEKPHAIICSLAHIITLDRDNNINPYSQWLTTTDNYHATPKIMPLTGSGCLYPYGILTTETFNINKIKKIAPTADDLWIGAMSKLSGVEICTPYKVSKTFTVISSSQKTHLGSINCIGNENDRTISRLVKYYPCILDVLIS